MKTPLTASSATDCSRQPMLFQDLGSRQVVADFSGGALSSDGGVLLLRQVDTHLGLTGSLAQCFGDERRQLFVDHSVRQLLAQRIYGLALGYASASAFAAFTVNLLIMNITSNQSLDLLENATHLLCVGA